VYKGNQISYDNLNEKLKKKITKADIEIVNDLTTGGIDKVLSAEQGKKLNDIVNEHSDKFEQHIVDFTEHIPYVNASGVSNSYTALIKGLNNYVEGLALSVKIPIQNTGSSTININELGAKTIVDGKGKAIKSGCLIAGGIYTLRFDGTNFFLQGGEGGEYGTADKAQVLTGYTLGTENGVILGTMPNQTNATTTANRNASGSGYLEISPAAGYYDGSTNSKTKISDSNFIPSNIKNGTSIFGITGTYESAPKYFKSTKNVLISSGYNVEISTSITSIGFTPKYWAIQIQDGETNAGYWGRFTIFGGLGGGLDAALLSNNGTQMYLYDKGTVATGTTLNIVLGMSTPWVLKTQTLTLDIHMIG